MRSYFSLIMLHLDQLCCHYRHLVKHRQEYYNHHFGYYLIDGFEKQKRYQHHFDPAEKSHHLLATFES